MPWVLKNNMTTEESLDEKWKIHQIVQNAVESAHSNPSPQTIKMFDELNKDIKEMKNDIKDVLIQATKTNGRVSRSEEWSEKAQKIIEHHTEKLEELKDSLIEMNASHKSDKRQVILAVSVATFFIGAIAFLGYDKIKNDTFDYADTRIDYAIEKSLTDKIEKVTQ